MTTSARESALAALSAAIAHALTAPPPAVPVLREEPVPQRIPPQGLVFVLDGAAAQEVPVLSPLRWQIEQEAAVVVFAPGATIAARQILLDGLLVRIGAALAADRTLGGAVEWCNPGSPSFEDAEFDGAAAPRVATVPVTLMFTAAGTPLA